MKITIASGKGGTGKTTLSTNLAMYLKSKKEDIVLTDLDVEEPNITQFLKGDLKNEYLCNKFVPQWEENNCTLCGHCSEICNFNAIVTTDKKVLIFNELCHSCFACSELCPTTSLLMKPTKIGRIKEFFNEFVFIEGCLDLGQEMAIPVISQTISYTNKKFQKSLNLFDAPPGTSCSFVEACRQSDFIFLVTEPTPFGLNDLKLAVETLKVIKKEFAVIINRDGIGNSEVEDYCNKESIQIITKIKNDKNVAKLYSNGKIIYNKVEHFKESLEEISSFIGGIK
ncbi:MinD superfamily P-loop ATPase [Malaciobacter marinus]|uniref:MinD superfamily P-loop ATPase n=1 Tax=Malaciobacter marinus TaxID=505249 RepID=A0A347TH09_9BACT|nr:ATP-binding protein [Malaciobacter marinus]AXX85887.1 MinD superfamily P-loop ATPase [Malaciobacter marinus]